MSNIIKRVLLILSPVLIGFACLQIMLALPSPWENILYWLSPVIMIVYWPWVGAYFAKNENMPYWRSLLYANAGILLCVGLYLVFSRMGDPSGYTRALLDGLSAFAMPMLPLIMGLWLFVTDASVDAYGSVINLVGSALLLMILFSAGYAYARLKQSAENEDTAS